MKGARDMKREFLRDSIANGIIERVIELAKEGLPAPQYNGHLQFVPDFGVWHLSVNEAAVLVVIDMWHKGVFPEVAEPDDYDGNWREPRILELLTGPIQIWVARLLKAVEHGRIEVAAVRRDLDDKLVEEKTYIQYTSLVFWLQERGYEYGDIFKEWLDVEAEIALELCNEVTYLRAAIKSGIGDIRHIALQGMLAKAGKLDESKSVNVVAAYKAIATENQMLKEQLANAKSGQPAKVDGPVSTRQRRTLLTIIAALCSNQGIDLQSRGAAQRIMEMTDDLGAHVDDGTIGKALSQIPDALETRMK